MTLLARVRRGHDVMLLLFLETIAQGNNRSRNGRERNTRYSVMIRACTKNVETANSIFDELESKGLIVTATYVSNIGKGRHELYELTEKGEQYRILLKRQRDLFDK